MKILQKIKNQFFSSQYPMVAVDISDASIEMMQLTPNFDKPRLKSAYRQELPEGLVVDGKITDLKKMADLLRQAYAKAKPQFTSDYCLLSLPDKQTYFLTLRNKTNPNFKQDIYTLAQERLPVDLNKCYYDFQLNSEHEAFFAAAPKEVVDQYKELFTLADLKLTVIDFESACLLRALLRQEELTEGVFIIDLGAKSTDLILLDRSGFRDQLNFELGGNQLSEKIAEKINKDFAEAEKIKKVKGLEAKEIDLAAVATETFQPVFEAIMEIAANYQAKTQQSANKIILAGGTSLLKGIEKIFSKNLPDFTVELGQIDKKIAYPEGLLKTEKILYANVLGLALRGLDKGQAQAGLNLITTN